MRSICFPAVAFCTLAFALSGCSSSHSSDTSNTDKQSTQEAATAISTEAAAISTSMTQAQVISQGGGALPDLPILIIAGCPKAKTVASGFSGWTNLQLTFANPPCSLMNVRSYSGLQITGTQELTRNDGDTFNFINTMTNYGWGFLKSDSTTPVYSELRNGTRTINANSTGATEQNAMTVVYTNTEQYGTLIHSLTGVFTPSSGSTIDGTLALPSGSFSLVGNAQWSGIDGTGGLFTVSTLVPLQYDSTCAEPSASYFDSGQLQVHLNGSTAGYSTITWSNCSAPSIAWVAQQ